MNVVMVECGNAMCSSAFGVADPDGMWETDEELARDMGWRADGVLIACSAECFALAQVAALVTAAAIRAAEVAANKAVGAHWSQAGIWMCTAAKYDGANDRFCIPKAAEHGLLAWSFELERDQLRREADALAVTS
jgi:hypothetical protein